MNSDDDVSQKTTSTYGMTKNDTLAREDGDAGVYRQGGGR